jgi:hypothetical protein
MSRYQKLLADKKVYEKSKEALDNLHTALEEYESSLTLRFIHDNSSAEDEDKAIQDEFKEVIKFDRDYINRQLLNTEKALVSLSKYTMRSS